MPLSLLLPTSYGALTLMAAWLLFELPILEWDRKMSTGSVFLFASSVAMFVSSAFFSALLRSSSFRAKGGGYAKPWTVIVTATFGAVGVVKYSIDFSAALGGGLVEFWSVLLSEPLRIRALAEETRSIGTQLSYFGWVSAAFSAHRLSGKSGSRLDVANVIGTLLLNLIWIDRTRPLWIGVTCLLCYLGGSDRIRGARAFKLLCFSFFSAVFFFIAWVVFTGKTGGQHDDDATGAIFNLVHYATAGPAYFAHMIESIEPTWSLANTLTPLLSVISVVTESQPPPSLVLETVWIPLSTNVGTGFEPFYMSGGWAGVVIGLVVYCIGFNAAAVLFLARGGAAGALGWSHLCFTSSVLFFVPKINSFTLWVILLVAVALSFPRLSRLTQGKTGLVVPNDERPRSYSALKGP